MSQVRPTSALFRVVGGLVLLSGMLLSSGAAHAASWPLLRNGSHGTDVRTVQRLLVAHGRNLTIDGLFGSGTQAAVVSFQRSRGLSADGVVGPMTWNALIITVKQGNSGQAVAAVQEQLGANGCRGVAIDGVFGPATNAAVRTFQRANRLAVDGIVGPDTWETLVSGGTCTVSGGGGGSGRVLPSNLRFSAAGAAFIATFEGFVATPYNDAAHNCTIGYGHLIHMGPCTASDNNTWGSITRDRGQQLLQSDANGFADGIRSSLASTPLHQYEFDALVSFAFNIGMHGFNTSSAHADLVATPPNYGAVPDHMLLWDKAGGQVLCGLYRRRVNEGHLFSTGSYAISSPPCPPGSRSSPGESAAVGAGPHSPVSIRPTP